MKWDKEMFDKAQAEVIAELRARPDESDREYGELLANSNIEEFFVRALLTEDVPPNKIAYLMARQFLTNLQFLCNEVTNGDSLMMLTLIGMLGSIEGVKVSEVEPDRLVNFMPTGGLPN
jgi:hypothetical protein